MTPYKKIFAVQPAKEEIEYKEPVMSFNMGGDGSLSGQQEKKDKKIGRNDPCPCAVERNTRNAAGLKSSE